MHLNLNLQERYNSRRTGRHRSEMTDEPMDIESNSQILLKVNTLNTQDGGKKNNDGKFKDQFFSFQDASRTKISLENGNKFLLPSKDEHNNE